MRLSTHVRQHPARRLAGLSGSPVLRLTVLFAGSLLLSALGAALMPAGSATAVWFPAAGLYVAMAMLLPHRGRYSVAVVVLVSSMLGIWAGGRSLDVSAAFAVANTGEALAASVLLGRRPGAAVIRTIEDLARILGITSAAALAGAVCAAVLVPAVNGSSVLQVGSGFFLAHAIASALVVPVLLLRTALVRSDLCRTELVVQLLVLGGVVAWVFWPVHQAQLLFLVLVPLVWVALRSGPLVTALHLVAVAVLVPVLTLSGGGPIAALADTQQTVHVLQVFLASCILVAFPLAVVVHQRQAVTAELKAGSLMYRQTFEQSLLGMVVLHDTAEGPRVTGSNQVALDLLRPEGHPVGLAHEISWSTAAHGTPPSHTFESSPCVTR